MHELTIVQALVEEVDRAAALRGATSVGRIHVSLGELSGVEPSLFASAYEAWCGGTVCSHAELELHAVAARWACPRCGLSRPPGELLSCPECGVPTQLVAGDEIVLERIEMEVP